MGATRGRRARTIAQLSYVAGLITTDVVIADHVAATDTDRQSLADAWWTGPLLTPSAATLPAGHFLVEPYLYDVISQGRFDAEGKRHRTADAHSFGSLTYLLYGLTDTLTAGVIPTLGFNSIEGAEDSSRVAPGDMSVQAQYRLMNFVEGKRLPTLSLVLQETLPTGRYDRLGSRPSDAMGSGAYTTMLGLYSQSYWWLPNGRILRTRLNLSHAFSDEASVDGVSVYGTPRGFQGRARPGRAWIVNSSFEYSLSRNWVLALDVVYRHDEDTRVTGFIVEPIDGMPQRTSFESHSGSSWQLGLAPAIEYNWSSRAGVIAGLRWIAAGRNATASVAPVIAINLVY
jgi:Putative MetA-pathway of phenol degradation